MIIARSFHLLKTQHNILSISTVKLHVDVEMVGESFKVCAMTVAADGNEDHLIHCFKEGEPCACGRELLMQDRQRQANEDVVGLSHNGLMICVIDDDGGGDDSEQ